ncbi:MAG: LPS-assembly protein LptD, partial [Pseudomonadota bacterium]
MRGLAVALLLLVATAAAAQDVTLEADRVDVRANGDVIIAEGNVTVSYDSQTLEARRITYDRRADRILAEGPLRLRSAEGVVLLASLAEVSADLRNGLIEGARLILNEELQIAATGGERIDGRYNGLDRVVATSCVVCAIRPVPLWRIRAARVIHDEEAERIWFRNAFFDVLGVPVAYTPALRIPAPGVRRATGALVPQASRSGIYGYGLKLPYYITLGDHADATLTPFITTDA